MEAKKRQALGLIETTGYAPLVMAVDSCLKAASVDLLSQSLSLVGGGLVMAAIEGDTGSVSAALSVAQATIRSLGADGMTHLIPRPDPSIWEMLRQDGLRVDDPEPTPEQDIKGGQSTSAPDEPSIKGGQSASAPDEPVSIAPSKKKTPGQSSKKLSPKAKKSRKPS